MMIIAFVMITLIHSLFTALVICADEKQLVDVQQIHLSFPDVTEERLEWDFPYSDEFFSIPSEEFCITMARGSMGLTLSAFRSKNEELGPQYESYLKEAGFTNIYGFGYDKPPAEYPLSGVIGMKRIGDITVIAAAACGQGYGNEWAGNFKVGTGERHEGFSQAAGLFEDHLARYMNDELKATRHFFMSLKRLQRLVFNVVVGLVLFLLECLIMYLVHRRQVKKGHQPFLCGSSQDFS